MSTSHPGLDIANLVVSYGKAPVLRGIDLQVPEGQIAAVLGASGSGKTTLLRSIAGFIRPKSGNIKVDHRTLVGPGVWLAPERRDVGLVPQEGALFPHLDVAGNVGFGLPKRTRAQRTEAAARVEQLLEFVSLGGKGAVQPHELSGGMQQRVALARALAREPNVVLLDEPFSALDAELRRELRGQVRELLAQAGTTAILVTHDEDEALDFADAVHRISDGRIVESPEGE
ncbi:MAG: ABC transporter ATP-binding protein [Actinobacteria bacterium]|nr:ABC transporter ATP-binding protein [Actinomycetota bacterium]